MAASSRRLSPGGEAHSSARFLSIRCALRPRRGGYFGTRWRQPDHPGVRGCSLLTIIADVWSECRRRSARGSDYKLRRDRRTSHACRIRHRPATLAAAVYTNDCMVRPALESLTNVASLGSRIKCRNPRTSLTIKCRFSNGLHEQVVTSAPVRVSAKPERQIATLSRIRPNKLTVPVSRHQRSLPAYRANHALIALLEREPFGVSRG